MIGTDEGQLSNHPTFLVLGAARCGTTSIHNYLGQHPEIYMSPKKETNFFAYADRSTDFDGYADHRSIDRGRIRTWTEYLALFKNAPSDAEVGESSPNYLYEPSTPTKIDASLADPKFIAGFRQPAERAFSDFLNMRKIGWEPLEDFEEALKREEKRIQKGWGPFYHYRNKGNYASQIERYLEVFERDRFHFYRFSDLQRDPVGLLQEIYDFLGVASFAPSVDLGYNASGVPRSRYLHDALSKSSPLARKVRGRMPVGLERRLVKAYQTFFLDRPELNAELRQDLTEEYRPEIRRLERIVDLDLSHWLEPMA